MIYTKESVHPSMPKPQPAISPQDYRMILIFIADNRHCNNLDVIARIWLYLQQGKRWGFRGATVDGVQQTL